ncbi:hypothetical protein KR074_004775 [Drosophila pseudoananassae]|nr:hypothetical protein KR074_004775 [Drosophila pseudoananassae]
MQNNSSAPKNQSSVCVLWLVICKTVRFQVGNLLTTLIIILGPMLVFVCYSTTIFLYRDPAEELHQWVPPINIRTDVPYLFETRSIYYSPKNAVVARVIQDMAVDLDTKQTKGFNNGATMIKALQNEEGFVGIEFEDQFRDITELPNKVIVSILFPTHLRNKPKMIWETGALYRHLHLTGDYYRVEGFLIVQSKLSEALIRAKNNTAKLPMVVLEHLPLPWISEVELNERRLSLAGFLVLPFTISAAYLTQMIVRDKEEHATAMLQLLNVNSRIHWTSWFIVGFIVLSIPTVLLVLLQKGRFYPKSDTSLVLMFLLVYIVELLCSAFMISVFVNDSIMVQIAILILHLISWLPWRLLLKGYQETFLRNFVSCFFLYSAVTIGVHQLIEHETLYRGMQWKHIFYRTDQDKHFTLGMVIALMLLGSVFRILVLFYVEALTGVRPRKWYFPIQRSFWCLPKRPPTDVEEPTGSGREPTPRKRPVIIQARNLQKVYNNHRVVDNFTLNFCQDEITVIMGHNDSGKTTILMMLSGIVQATSGEVIINGFDINTETRKARRSMMICPQHNILFEKNKVEWHINFYCRLKGMSRSEAAAETQRYLEVSHLQEYANDAVVELPSGMKRMLSVCCALCGRSKIVILDEPCTSMDPLVRRGMWDLLRRERMGRCIIIATHNMYESEVLADRIVFLCNGRVLGYGTPGFLTQVPELGAVFKLTCAMDESCLVSEVTHFLQKRIPGIVLDNEHSIFVSYKLPTKNIREFSNLFGDLEDSLGYLRITGFTVEAPTLSNMFLRIGEEMNSAHDRTISVLRESHASPLGSLISLLPSFEVREHNPIQIVHNQWRAIMIKKWIFTKRHKSLYITMILFPILTFILVFLSELFIFFLHTSDDPLFVTDLSKYSDPVLVTESANNAEFIEAYREMAEDRGATVVSTEHESIHDYVLRHLIKNEVEVQKSFLAGVTVIQSNKTIIAWQNTMLEHGSALALGLVYKALGKHSANLEIEIVNKPRPDDFTDVVIGLNEFNSVEFSGLVCFYLVLATATFAVMPVLERETDMRHLQLSNGMSRATYWMAHMAWDLIIYMVMVVSLIFVVGLTSGTALPMLLLLLAFGFAAISFTYMLCLISGKMGSMFSLIMYINMLGKPWISSECGGIIRFFAGVVAIFVHPNKEKKRFLVFECILLVIPHYALFCGEQNILTEDERFHGYQLRMADSIRDTEKSDTTNTSTNPVIYNNLEFLYLLISGVIYFLLVIYSWIPRRIVYFLKSIKNENVQPNTKDEDVEVERLRQRMEDITKHKFVNYPLILRRATKRYDDLVAVRCLTLDLNPFECLCLLGRNGAGKSSTFYMIVGKIPITAGDIYIKGMNVKKDKRCLRHVGFCPREPILATYMTGRQMLHFSCLNNGVRRDLVKEVVDHMEQSFVLDRQLDKLIRNCSNGTRRKLMLAIASLAPTLICLDEPTAGVDMNAKYNIWHVLDSLRLGGLAILLTTNSMEECEVLATNLGILERGSLLCYGTLTRLKNRFDKNIFVKVKVGSPQELAEAKEESERYANMMQRRRSMRESDAPLDVELPPRIGSSTILGWRSLSAERTTDAESRPLSESDIRSMYEKLLRKVEVQFVDDHPYSKVSERFPYRGIIIFSIPKGDIRYSEIFHYMEKRKRRMQILYYSISHTTLGDVFMDFISKHHVDRRL